MNKQEFTYNNACKQEALIRYKTIDRCQRNRYRRWTIEDLVDACSDALYDMEGIRKRISLRTVQGDIQMMRSDKLGYNAPIEVYDQRYYRYADPQYSITDMPLSEDDFLLLKKAVDLLGKNENLPQNGEIYKVLKKKEPLDSNSELCINEKAPVPADGIWSFL